VSLNEMEEANETDAHHCTVVDDRAGMGRDCSDATAAPSGGGHGAAVFRLLRAKSGEL
jgi:hypothetical protein